MSQIVAVERMMTLARPSTASAPAHTQCHVKALYGSGSRKTTTTSQIGASEAASNSDAARQARLAAVPIAIMSRQYSVRRGTRLASLSVKNFTLSASNSQPRTHICNAYTGSGPPDNRNLETSTRGVHAGI